MMQILGRKRKVKKGDMYLNQSFDFGFDAIVVIVCHFCQQCCRAL